MYVLSYLYSAYFVDLYLPWHAEVVPVGLFYMMIGFYMKGIYHELKDNRRIYFPIFSCLSAILFFYLYYIKDYYYAIDAHFLGNVILSPVLAIMLSTSVILACSIILDAGYNLKVLTYMGRNSMIYYGIQQAVVSVLALITSKAVSVLPLPLGLLSIGTLMMAVLLSTLLVVCWNSMVGSRFTQ